MSESVFAVMRKAVLPEDEGMDRLYRLFPSKREAEDWVACQTGYFTPGDFYIEKAQEKPPSPEISNERE